MLLAEVLTPAGLLPEGFDAASYGLVFGQDAHDSIMALQTDALQHRIAPVPTADGRYLVCADVLSEARRGIYKPIFDQIPPETAVQVAIMPWGDAVALLPVVDPMEQMG